MNLNQQLEELKKIFKYKSIYSTQPNPLNNQEFIDIVDKIKITHEDGEHTISKDICLTFKNGRVFITTNKAIHGTE